MGDYLAHMLMCINKRNVHFNIGLNVFWLAFVDHVYQLITITISCVNMVILSNVIIPVHVCMPNVNQLLDLHKITSQCCSVYTCLAKFGSALLSSKVQVIRCCSVCVHVL